MHSHTWSTSSESRFTTIFCSLWQSHHHNIALAEMFTQLKHRQWVQIHDLFWLIFSNAHPTTQLTRANPINTPAPTRTISGTLSQWPFSPRLTGLRAPEVVSGEGGGPSPLPPRSRERLPPSERTVSASWQGGGYCGVKGRPLAEQCPGLSPWGGTWLGTAIYTRPPRPLPPSPIILHPISRYPCWRTSGNHVQDHGGGARVWVPTIAVGWDRGGFDPLASTPCAWEKSCRWRPMRGISWWSWWSWWWYKFAPWGPSRNKKMTGHISKTSFPEN